MMMFDQMGHQFTERIQFIKGDANAAGIPLCRLYQKHRYLMLRCRRQNILHDGTAFQALGIYDHNIDHGKIHELKDARLAPVKRCIPEKICCRVVNETAPVLFQKRLIHGIDHALRIFILYF